MIKTKPIVPPAAKPSRMAKALDETTSDMRRGGMQIDIAAALAAVADRVGDTTVKRGRPRLENAAKTTEALKPWLTANPPMSRASWYRRRAERK